MPFPARFVQRKRIGKEFDWSRILEMVHGYYPTVEKMVTDFLEADPRWRVHHSKGDLPPDICISFCLKPTGAPREKTIIDSTGSTTEHLAEIPDDDVQLIADFVGQILRVCIGLKVYLELAHRRRGYLEYTFKCANMEKYRRRRSA